MLWPFTVQSLSLITGTLLLFLLVKEVYKIITSPLRPLPAPPVPSWLYGNDREIDQSDDPLFLEKWVDKYGRSFRTKWLFFQDRLNTADPKAVSHIITNDGKIYKKPETIRWILGRILGNGVLVTEGEKHKAQRKVMDPAFGSAQIRELTSYFVEESIHLRDIWISQIVDNNLDNKNGVAQFDAQSWLSRMTLDVIGRAGFNYNFNALNPHSEPNELNKAFGVIFGRNNNFTVWNLAQALIPDASFTGARTDAVPSSPPLMKPMTRIGQGLINESKAELKAFGEKDTVSRPKDLLSLLVRSNLSESAKQQRLSDEDILSQVPTFIVAGHETTSTAVAWSLYALTQHPLIQTKLRQECLSLGTEEPTMEQLNSLPYLDAVVRESLRVHPPAPVLQRVAREDDVLPLQHPFTDKDGIVHTEIRIRKGQVVIIPIAEINRDKAIWGQDASDFKPERWENLPDTSSSMPGIWGHQLTFFAGNRACIGYRFSIIEMKALLFTLIKAFEFELAVPKEDIVRKLSIVQRPAVKSQPEEEVSFHYLLGYILRVTNR
ncbi:cytochrome P450 [Gymnopus androsaceus JB14]|uniref:Cytochrome P450 n=1 Tax=Gymnopus androsaceus JB14 TaxID=1447944 RepID=A0A6A4HBQ1_9AGAR|nr:cytochrome P450 [Gymnopus androsaceus JB14]